jgi:hypothetical protein
MTLEAENAKLRILLDIAREDRRCINVNYCEAMRDIAQSDSDITELKAEIERLRTALAKVVRAARRANMSNWITGADAAEHIMRMSQYAEDALSPTPPPTASAGAPEAMPPRETKGTT